MPYRFAAVFDVAEFLLRGEDTVCSQRCDLIIPWALLVASNVSRGFFAGFTAVSAASESPLL
jgi:hypothetical protein